MSYSDAVSEKKFVPNIVLKFKGVYWSIRQPDSGLTVDHPGLLDQVAINPTKVDPFQANTTINSYTFKLLDKEQVVTALFNGVTSFFQNELVEIWIGRVGMDFADYMKLPDTYVSNVSRDKNAYSFKSVEIKNRINRPAFNTQNKLEVDILASTIIIDAAVELSGIFPASGMIKIEDEFISYAGLDLVNNRFLGCIRGEKSSIPAAHDQGETIYLVSDVTGNPIDILLQILVSSGGGSDYDVLTDGAAIDSSLINVEQFEEIRDEYFSDQEYNLSLYGIDSLLEYLEGEILYPNELRLISDNTSKISLAVLNRRIFDDDLPVIDEDTLIKQPDYSVDDSKIINSVRIEYDFAEGTGKYRKSVTLEDEDSISTFGRRDTLEIKLKGVKDILDGEEISTNIAQRFLSRFALPKPEISFTTQMDKSLVQLGEKIELVSSQLPTDTGDLNFVDTLEVIERGINWKTGDVKFKVAFTSFTGIRECYLAPSDSILEFTSIYSIRVGAGRGALYRPGWKMRLFSDSDRDYVSEQVNEIASIDGDVLTFTSSWQDIMGETYLAKEDGDALLQQNGFYILVTVLLNNTFRVMFADYDDVSETQKRYCFISNDGLDFSDKKSYQITL